MVKPEEQMSKGYVEVIKGLERSILKVKEDLGSGGTLLIEPRKNAIKLYLRDAEIFGALNNNKELKELSRKYNPKK